MIRPTGQESGERSGQGGRRSAGPSPSIIAILALIALVFPAMAAAADGGESANEALVPRAAETEARNGDLSFELVSVEVWPEYDQPQVLVLNEFVLPADTPLPLEFDLALPKGAEITAMGEVDDQGTYRSAEGPPPIDRSGDEWDVARVTITDFGHLQLEYYYDPGLELEGTRRWDLIYELPGSAVEARLLIQHPGRSTEFKLEPPLTEQTIGEAGYQYEGQRFANVAGGDRFQVGVEYTKEDPHPAVDPGTDPLAQKQEPAGDESRDSIFVVVGVVGVAAVAAVGYGLWQRRRGKALAACAECGEAWGTADAAFCSSCGAKRR